MLVAPSHGGAAVAHVSLMAVAVATSKKSYYLESLLPLTTTTTFTSSNVINAINVSV